MFLYQATVVDSFADEWRRSRYQGAVTVRASDETEARIEMDIQFGIAAQKPLVGSPWINPAIVEVRRIDDSRFSPDGPVKVLDPDPRTVQLRSLETT